MRMRGLTADSGVDNVLLEWTLMLELATVRPSPRPCRVVPLLFGHVTSAGGCPLTLGDILRDRSPGDATTTLTAAEMVPDVVVTSVVDTVDRFLRSKGLTPSAELRTRSARTVYRDITGYIGVALHSICAKSLPATRGDTVGHSGLVAATGELLMAVLEEAGPMVPIPPRPSPIPSAWGLEGWLETHDLLEYAGQFREQGYVSVRKITSLNADDIISDVGIVKKADQRLLRKAWEELKEKAV